MDTSASVLRRSKIQNHPSVVRWGFGRQRPLGPTRKPDSHVTGGGNSGSGGAVTAVRSGSAPCLMQKGAERRSRRGPNNPVQIQMSLGGRN